MVKALGGGGVHQFGEEASPTPLPGIFPGILIFSRQLGSLPPSLWCGNLINCTTYS